MAAAQRIGWEHKVAAEDGHDAVPHYDAAGSWVCFTCRDSIRAITIEEPPERTLSQEARRLLAAILDCATFESSDRRRRHDVVGNVYTLDAFPAASDVPRSAWVELVTLTGRPEPMT